MQLNLICLKYNSNWQVPCAKKSIVLTQMVQLRTRLYLQQIHIPSLEFRMTLKYVCNFVDCLFLCNCRLHIDHMIVYMCSYLTDFHEAEKVFPAFH